MTQAVIFFDIDGTLVDSQGQVPLENRRAIQLLKAQDCLPVICTGRGRGEMGTIMADSGINTAILLSSMEIIHAGELIYQGRIAPETVQLLKKRATEHQHLLGYYSQGSIKVLTHNETLKRNFAHFHQALPEMTDTTEAEENCQMLLLFSDQPELDNLYREGIPQLTFARNSPYSIDVTPTGTDKGAGIQHLLQLLHLSVPTYAFGDGLNDLSMFSAVDTAIAMENGRAETKQVADYITQSNDHQGIPKALEKLGLIHSENRAEKQETSSSSN